MARTGNPADTMFPAPELGRKRSGRSLVSKEGASPSTITTGDTAMRTFNSFAASALAAAATLSFVVLSTSAQAQTCGAWRCGYNGTELNDLKYNGMKPNGWTLNGNLPHGIQMQGTAPNSTQPSKPTAVTLPSGETLNLK